MVVIFISLSILLGIINQLITHRLFTAQPHYLSFLSLSFLQSIIELKYQL